MRFATNNILLMLNNHCIHALRRKVADHFSEVSESDIKRENKLGDWMIKQYYWIWLSQNIKQLLDEVKHDIMN